MTPLWRNQDMDTLQEQQLHQFLRGLAQKVTTVEAGATMAVSEARKASQELWDLFAQLVEHDHCELCGRAVWNGDHEC